MPSANSNINIASLDFDNIKSTLQTYLRNQNNFADYNFSGSVISTVLDLLSYNTFYNGFYLNMVANEMFLDTALKRSSVISHSKVLNYTPKSCTCSQAIVNITLSGVTTPTFTIPKYTLFQSEPINGINTSFVTLDSYSTQVINGIATFNNIILYQGQPVSYSFTVDQLTNPNSIFKLPDSSIDTSTLNVMVFPFAQSTSFVAYNQENSYLTLDSTSNVYFVQESLDGYYEIYFGDGILGNQLINSNVVVVEYISTNASIANGVKQFTLMNNLGNYTSISIATIQSAQGGTEKESIDSIKFQAPKSWAAQNRAVVINDYITLLQQNSFGYTFDSVNAWGGEDNIPPVYGTVFVSAKLQGGYELTEIQKQRIITDILKPKSVMLTPILITPDYTYVSLIVNVLYDQKSTILTKNQLENSISGLVQNFLNSTLNQFNSTYDGTSLGSIIKGADNSVITSEIKLQIQKKFLPNLTSATSYKLYFGTPLAKGSFLSGVHSSPPLKFRDKSNLNNIIDGIQIEEVPTSTVGVESISIINSGINYQSVPNVTILGDGVGATAVAVLTSSGSIRSINVTNSGSGYSSAIVQITPQLNDSSGMLGSAVVNLNGKYGTLRLYYYNSNNVKTIYSDNIGLIDYDNGIIELTNFNPIDVDNSIGQLTISATPLSSIFSSSFNRIITLDSMDSSAITVNATTKK